jgi:T5SS/PEP-CTERM-associated repeat protein
VDLATGASRAAGPRAPFPVEHVLERMRVNLDPLQPNAGVLRLLSPSLADPSLVVNSGGRLLVDNGSVAAQSALVGEDGLGTVEVTNGNLFQTDGTLVLGRDGEGRLILRGGANALTNEVVMGEGREPGNAVVSGAGSLWIVDRLHVSKSEPSTIEIQDGGELDASEAVVDRAPQGALPNVTIGDTGTWQVDRLDVRGDGFVDCAGGAIEPRNPGTPGEIAVGTSSPGTAQLLLRDECAVSTKGDLVIGNGGDGLVTVDASGLPNTSLLVEGTLRAGLGRFDAGSLTVLGSITGGAEHLRAGALEYLGGDLVLGHGDLGTVSGPATIGRGPGVYGRAATVSLLGNGPPEVTRLRIDHAIKIDGGTLEVRNALLSTGGVLEIGPGSLLHGLGSDNVVDAVTGIVNHGSLWGPLRLPPGTRILSASTGTVVNLQAGAGSAPQLSPLAASAFARAVRSAAPEPPPAGVLTFEGDGEVAGTLVVQFRNGFAPGAGDPIRLVETGGTLDGSFSEIVVRGLAPGAQFDVSAAGGALTAVALADTEALPTVSVAAKPKLKEKKKAGAKVKLTRTGDLSAPLLVSYALRGTARSGIDYDLLPGTIEIPAGKRSAKLALRPRQDGLVEGPETILLEVLPGDDYAPGLASEAEITLTSADVIPPPKQPRR